MTQAVILFDGVCNLCHGIVQFVIARDPAGYFKFAALQSKAAARTLADARPNVAGIDSIVVVEDRRALIKSAATLQILRRLRFPWPLLYGLIAVPRPIRDWVYDRVARRRYGWFGKKDQCMLPTPDIQERFLK